MLPAAVALDGTELFPGVQSAGTVKMTIAQVATFLSSSIGSVPKKVTDSTTIALLANSSNWGTTNQYTGTTITGQNTGDWYDDGSFRYLFVTNTAVSRIPYALL